MHADNREHWNHIYTVKTPEELSWHQHDPDVSLRLIERYASPGSSIIDVGAGSSTLVALLVDRGFSPCTVVDLAEEALQQVRSRLDPQQTKQIRFKVADILNPGPLGSFDLWHDRAVFHFLTEHEDRMRYVRIASETVLPGGHLILGAYGPEGPDRCSGLPVCRYDSATVAEMFSPSFRFVASVEHLHKTPWGAEQQFIFTVLLRETV